MVHGDGGVGRGGYWWQELAANESNCALISTKSVDLGPPYLVARKGYGYVLGLVRGI